MLQALFFAAAVVAQSSQQKSYARIGGSDQTPGALNVGRPYPQSEGVTRNGVPVFTGKFPDAQVWDWPAYYTRQGYTMSITIPETGKVPKDGFVEFYCADNGPCDVAVFLYECYPCPSKKGGLPEALLGLDEPFTRSRCAPQFTLRKGGAKQRMMAYIRTVDASTTTVFKMPDTVEYVLFGISDGQGSPCPDLGRLRCINTAGHCAWRERAGRCEYATCIQKGPGGCNPRTCVAEEKERALA